MRTTLNFPDALARAAKKRAAKEGKTFTAFLEEAVRERLAQPEDVVEASPLPTYRPSRPGTLIDLDDKNAVRNAMDEISWH